MTKILLLTDFSSGYSRNLLKGIVRYAKKIGTWSFLRMPLYFRILNGEEGVINWAKKWKVDAIIAQLDNVNIEMLNSLGIPIIVQNYRDRNTHISNLTGDYIKTGAIAARFYISRGYKHFAFYGFKDTIWSRERLKGYKDELDKHNYKLHVFESGEENNDNWNYNPAILGDWLKSLPKPIALFACDDFYALQVSETCHIYHIDIPDDIAIMGVDNDELMCNISDPPLSSIALDVENGGYRAARLLDQLIKKEITKPFNVIVDPLVIIKRNSTEKYAVSNKYIHNVLEYIENNYAETIAVSNLVDLVPMSRRVLERVFKANTGLTIHQYIQNFRIEHFKNLLLSTDLPLSEAASKSGFEDVKNVSRVFRKYSEFSPAEYRRKCRFLSYNSNDALNEYE